MHLQHLADSLRTIQYMVGWKIIVFNNTFPQRALVHLHHLADNIGTTVTRKVLVIIDIQKGGQLLPSHWVIRVILGPSLQSHLPPPHWYIP